MRDIFFEVREQVSAEDAARRYGLTFDRRGWALCPFHEDKHPSMSFRAGRFHCWACGAAGDAIDFVSRMFGLDAMGAVRRLNEDFHLGLPLDRLPTPEERQAAHERRELATAHIAFEKWRESFINQLNAAFRAAEQFKRKQDLSDREIEAVKHQAEFEYWADTLAYGSPEEQAAIYRDRGQLARWIDVALKN